MEGQWSPCSPTSWNVANDYYCLKGRSKEAALGASAPSPPPPSPAQAGIKIKKEKKGFYTILGSNTK